MLVMELERKVHAINETTRLLEKNYNYLLPQLNEFIGKKIYLQTGGKSAKFKKEIQFLDEQPEQFGSDYAQLHFLNLKIIGRFLFLEISCCFKKTDSTCFYESDNVYIGELEQNGTVLKSVGFDKSETKKVFRQYDVKNVRNKLKRIENLRKELRTLKSEYKQFMDNYYD
jgi:hypothetical protein